MKITFVLPFASLGGGVRAVAMYARLLAAMGHQVTVVSTPRKEVPLRRRIGSLLRGGGWIASPATAANSHLDALDGVTHHLLDRFRPVEDRDVPDADFVIATWWETAEWVHKLSPGKGQKFYFVQHHETVFDNQPSSRVEATYRLPMRKITVARWLSELLHHQYGAPRVPVVPCGIDHTIFTAPPRGKQKRPTVGMMYASAHFKGADIALAAVDLAARNVPGLQLLAFGEKPPAPPVVFPKFAEFEQRPPQQRLAEIYANCDAWLFASRCEGFGLPVIEAMSCRTPVIGAPTGVAPEALAGGGGILVRPEDPQAMAVAIERISRMKGDDWERMSQFAHSTAEQFTWEKSAKLFESALLAPLHTRQPRRMAG